MKDSFNRMLIWGCSLAIIQLITLIVLTFTCGTMIASAVNMTLLLPMTLLGAWGGMMARRRGWILSKKFL